MPAGVYLHIPFCKSRCSYCDFATDVYRSSDAVERYVDAIVSEIRYSKFEIRNLIDTIYFGGGTPSLLEHEQVETILTSVFSVFSVANDAEVTMEMNPATVTPEKLAAYRELGVNRASFGVQTFNDRDLKLLARGHDANDAHQTYRMLRDAGFTNISFDLIAGLPGQTMKDWQTNLDQAIEMSPEHISLYLLEIHESTPLAEQVRSGRRTPIEDELAAEMYELMLVRLAVAGYAQYEISNFAKPGFESRHNTKYWRLDPVFGFGVSAHSFDGTERYANEPDTSNYVGMLEKKGSAEVIRESIDLANETVFLGLRMCEGVDLDEHRRQFGIDILEQHGSELAEFFEAGLLEINERYLRLTSRGKLFSNEIFALFV